MDETFLLTNIAPQVGDGFNRHYWAYFEDFSRRLTSSFTDVYVFTIPLYLPSKSPVDGKWRVNYEVIGNPPSISVPTHFSKVILTSRPPKGDDPNTSTRREISMAGFVLPNAVIPDEASLESFLVPGEFLMYPCWATRLLTDERGLLQLNTSRRSPASPSCRTTSSPSLSLSVERRSARSSYVASTTARRSSAARGEASSSCPSRTTSRASSPSSELAGRSRVAQISSFMGKEGSLSSRDGARANGAERVGFMRGGRSKEREKGERVRKG